MLRIVMSGFATLEVAKGNHIITLDAVKLITSAMPIHNCKLKINNRKKKRANNMMFALSACIMGLSFVHFAFELSSAF